MNTWKRRGFWKRLQALPRLLWFYFHPNGRIAFGFEEVEALFEKGDHLYVWDNRKVHLNCSGFTDDELLELGRRVKGVGKTIYKGLNRTIH